MSRFVFVSFVFLGWAFYELSGGADFQPPERAVRMVAQAPVETTRIPQQSVASLVPDRPILVPRDQREAAPRSATVQPAADRTGTGDLQPRLASGLSLFPTATGTETLQLASLEDGVAGLVQTTVTDETPEPAPETFVREKDMREITGTRVNMRQGPGTNYPILKRLTIGQQVEVLDDSGTGWLRLRAMPDQTMGWIAASLVSKKRP